MAGGYDVDVLRAVRIPVGGGGGDSLAADVFLPRAAAPVPALVTLLPYRRDALGGAGCWQSLEFFARNGYAGVLVDLRGLGSSDGRAQPPFDPSEGEDGAAVVQWAASQPWCSGVVGAWGFSYGAALALRTATRRPAALRAVVSVLGLTDAERDFVHPSGVAGALGSLGVWGLGTLVNQVLPPLLDFHDPAEQRRWWERATHADPYLLDMYRHGPGHDVWRSRAIDVAGLTTPTLCFGGWRDVFCAASPRLYEELAGPKKLVLGPWMHSMPQDAAVAPVDFHALALRWWDRWLRGYDNGVDAEPPVTVYVQGEQAHWRGLDSWPPTGCTTWTATRSRGLLAQPTGESGPRDDGPAEPDRAGGDGFGVTLASDPTVGTRSGLWGIPNGGFGAPLDQHDDDTRSLTFTSQPQERSVLLLGRPEVVITGSGGRLVVKLTDVDPAGRSVLICGGVSAGAGARRRRVPLDPVGYRLPAGHRLRVSVSDAAFPRLWPGCSSPPIVDALTLLLPTPGECGEPVTVNAPQPPPVDAPVRETPQWEIHREPLTNRVTVVLGDDLHAVLPGTGQIFSQQTELRASPRAGAPAEASIGATSTVRTRLATGEQITVRVALLLHPRAGTATAQVHIDDAPMFSREWTVCAAEPADHRGGQEQR